MTSPHQSAREPRSTGGFSATTTQAAQAGSGAPQPTATAAAAAAVVDLAVVSATYSERVVLNALLAEDRGPLGANVASILAPDDFFEATHNNLYSVWQQLNNSGRAHDLPSVLDAAARKDLFIGGETYVVDLVTDATLSASSDESVLTAATRIKDLSRVRLLHAQASQIAQRAASGQMSSEDLVQMLEDAASNARNSMKSSRSGLQHITRFGEAILGQLEAKLSDQPAEQTTTTGWLSLNRLLNGGFVDEDYIVVGARPSMGKTAVLLNVCKAAAKEGRTVAIWSLEMRGAAMAKRAIQSEGRVHADAFNVKEVLEQSIDRIMDATTTLGALPIYIDEEPGVTLAEIRARARLLKEKHPKMLIALDYLQLVAAPAHMKPGTDARIVTSEISRGLKQLARELQCPVIALSQLSREVEKRANKRPMLSDLRESGQIEQDADVVMFLYRDEYYNSDTNEPGITEVIVAKQREGATATVKLNHNLATMTYEEYFQ